MSYAEKRYALKISIDLPENTHSIWRMLEIRGEASLAELSDALLACFGWTGVHKHEFIAQDGSWKATSTQYGPPEFDETYENEEEILLSKLALQEGGSFIYNYDMTDPWSHIIKIVEIADTKATPVTRLSDGAHAGIPEDCGGASGFQEFMEALNPEDPEHRAMAAWYKTECPNGGGVYNPEKIEFAHINKRLAELAVRQ